MVKIATSLYSTAIVSSFWLLYKSLTKKMFGSERNVKLTLFAKQITVQNIKSSYIVYLCFHKHFRTKRGHYVVGMPEFAYLFHVLFVIEAIFL